MSSNNNNDEKSKRQDEPSAVRMSRMLREKVLPAMAAKGVFGQGWAVEDATCAPIGGLGEDHWASTTLSTSVRLRSAGGETRTLSLVSKCMLEGDSFGDFFDVHAQADNEVNMYNEVFPFFQRLRAAAVQPTNDDIYPKCYWARSHTDGLLSLTIMEDLRTKGYRLAKERTALDRQHVTLALRAIGRMHALSYAAKARCRQEFLERVVPLLREASYTDKWRVDMAPLMGGIVYRGVDRLEARLREDGDAARLGKLDRMRAALGDTYAIMSGAAAAREPTAVIAHGDFCRNNMQFHYEEQRPTRACLFDFQTSRYCSPALDLAFFLFLNTSAELRDSYWDALLREYHDSLSDELHRLLDGHDVHPDYVPPTLEMLRTEMRRHALYGYVIVSFFLPQMMMRPEDIMPMDEAKRILAEDPSGMVPIMLKQGGDEATEALATVVRQFVDLDLIP